MVEPDVARAKIAAIDHRGAKASLRAPLPESGSVVAQGPDAGGTHDLTGQTVPMRVGPWLLLLALVAAAQEETTVREDFDGRAPGRDWLQSNATWRVAGGELRGKGGGQLDYKRPLSGELRLTFEAWTSEKANVEVKLIDPATGRDRFTFAFLGRYHSVLKGVKCCMLKANRFVATKPEMWIFPGRRFRFEVRKNGGQYQMRLDGALGPVFVDKQPAAGPYTLRIIVAPATGDGAIAIDKIAFRAKAAGANVVRPAGKKETARPAPAAEPVLETARTRNLVVKNHADASLETGAIARDLQTMYDFLAKYVGAAPERVIVHIGKHHRHGFARPSDPPEMFLKAASIFDTSADYAHEMMHCFVFRYGSLPHWFNESLSDMAYLDSEIELYKRRKEKPFLQNHDRIDHRSFELVRLRVMFGRGFFRKVCRLMEKKRKACRATFQPGVPLERKNALILSLLSEAAGKDLTVLFTKEFGFDPRTRERQRGY